MPYVTEQENLFRAAIKDLQFNYREIILNKTTDDYYTRFLKKLRNDNRLIEYQSEEFYCEDEYFKDIQKEYGITLIEVGDDFWVED